MVNRTKGADGRHEALFQPGRIGNLLIRNRIVMTPMGTLAETPEGTVSDRAIDYYAERARGGVGMIITGGQLVSNKLESWTFGWSALDTDQQTKAWKLLTDRVKAYGARICVQLSPGLGRAGFAWPGMERIFPSASAIPSIYYPEVLTKPMTTDEIDYIIGCMARAAARAKTAGFDAIQIHGHVGYMIDQFMTPAWNLREDKYGGSLENRMRFLTEMIDAIREQVGPDMPILFRFCMDHCFDGGRTLEEGQEIIRFLDANSSIDAYDINIGSYDYHPSLSLNTYFGDQPLLYAVKAAREATAKPLLNAGNHTPEKAAAPVEEGLLDFISLGRSLLADPEWANKVKAGRTDEVRPCIRCNEYCLNGVWQGMTASCAVNARCSAEIDYDMAMTANPRKIAVIGGGPAGMEAARVAALRGHKVDLYEQEAEMGGNLRVSTGPYKTQLAKLLAYYRSQLDALGVNIHLGRAIDPDAIRDGFGVDNVIVATGARQIAPDIAGIDGDNVMSVKQAYLARRGDLGRSIVIIGGDRIGCDAALEFVDEGRKVVIVEPGAQLAQSVSYDDQAMLAQRLRERGVEILMEHKPLRFTAQGVVVDGGTGERLIEAETVLYDYGRTTDPDTVSAFAFAHPETIAIGDCDKTGVFGEAIRRGFFTAWGLQ